MSPLLWPEIEKIDEFLHKIDIFTPKMYKKSLFLASRGRCRLPEAPKTAFSSPPGLADSNRTTPVTVRKFFRKIFFRD